MHPIPKFGLGEGTNEVMGRWRKRKPQNEVALGIAFFRMLQRSREKGHEIAWSLRNGATLTGCPSAWAGCKGRRLACEISCDV